MTIPSTSIRDLLSSDDLDAIEHAPLHGGTRHPTWYPVFSSEQRAVDALANAAVARISNEPDGVDWLEKLRPRLANASDAVDAAAALAELRAYGAFLEAGFAVRPIPTDKKKRTPEFQVDAGDGPIIVEVFAKHQDGDQKQLLDAVVADATPPGVEQTRRQWKDVWIETTVVEHTPGGAPDSAKPHDSVQANLISRICAVECDEGQLPEDRPSLLWVDFVAFGVWPEALKLDQTSPLISGHQGLTSGAFWYAFYGWRGAPIFEEDFPRDRIVPMGHDGRFRLSGEKKSKLSGVVLVIHAACTLLARIIH